MVRRGGEGAGADVGVALCDRGDGVVFGAVGVERAKDDGAAYAEQGEE